MHALIISSLSAAPKSSIVPTAAIQRFSSKSVIFMQRSYINAEQGIVLPSSCGLRYTHPSGNL